LSLFGGAGKKLIAALGEPNPDWHKLRQLSDGAGRDKGVSEKTVLSLLVQRACEADSLPLDEFGAVLRNLTASGIDLNSPVGPRGETPLQLCTAGGKATVAEALILAGASAVATSGGGSTALHTAASIGSLSLCELLLNSGADINAEDAEGNSPLHYAVSRPGNEKLAEVLLERGALVWARNREGKTPAIIARSGGGESYITLLEAALNRHRTSRLLQWKCPGCGYAVDRPVAARVEWLVALGVWDHLGFRCGSCGRVSPAPVLDGER
jgi:ankyrin repeat protein